MPARAKRKDKIMAVRNFWVDAHVDGRSTSLSGGPRSKDGGMSVTLKVRQDGSIADAVHISAIAQDDGTLRIRVAASAGVDFESADQGFILTTKR